MPDGGGQNDIAERLKQTALDLEHYINSDGHCYHHEIARLLQSIHNDIDQLGEPPQRR